MAAYTGSFNFYESLSLNVGNSQIDLSDTSSDTFKVLLTTSAYTPLPATHTILSDITNELTSTGGYLRQSITGVTWTEVAGVSTFDANNSTYTATAADYDAARYWVLFDDTTTSPLKALIAYGYIDDTPADVTVVDGTSLTLQWHNSGLFTLGG
jgi:hypothetical protein